MQNPHKSGLQIFLYIFIFHFILILFTLLLWFLFYFIDFFGLFSPKPWNSSPKWKNYSPAFGANNRRIDAPGCGDLRQKVMDISAPQRNCSVVWMDLYLHFQLYISNIVGCPKARLIPMQIYSRSQNQFICNTRAHYTTTGPIMLCIMGISLHYGIVASSFNQLLHAANNKYSTGQFKWIAGRKLPWRWAYL